MIDILDNFFPFLIRNPLKYILKGKIIGWSFWNRERCNEKRVLLYYSFYMFYPFFKTCVHSFFWNYHHT